MIKSHLLYQLSYAPGTGRESLRKRASFSKAIPRCPANLWSFPGPLGDPPMAKKPPDSGGFSEVWRVSPPASSKPPGVAPAAMVPARAAIPIVTTIPIVAAVAVPSVAIPLELTVPPVLAFATVSHVGQDLQAALLAVIQRLVERVGRIRHLLQLGAPGRPVVGA